jgi:F-type H+-transporting ATPase subunit epsilon
MHLEIVTPDKKIFEGEVVSSTFPGADGTFQILNSHAPIISPLANGTLSYEEENGTKSSIEVAGGVVEVSNNKIIVLAEGVK